MCNLGQFIHNFCFDEIDSLNHDSGTSSIVWSGLLIEAVIFIVSVSLLHGLNSKYTAQAVECMRLRLGGKSEEIMYLLHSFVTCVPEMFLTFAASLKMKAPVSSRLSILSRLGAGLMAFFMLPALFSIKSDVVIPTAVMVRGVLLYVIALFVIGCTIMNGNITVLDCASLILVYGLLVWLVFVTHKYEQRERDFKRDRNLLMQLTATTAASVENDILPRKDELCETIMMSTSNRTGIIYSLASVDLPSRILRCMCISSVPGTETERYYPIALLNALFLELLFSFVVASITERWLNLLSGSILKVSVTVFGLLVIPLVTHSGHFLNAAGHQSTVTDMHSSHTALTSIWTSLSVSSTLGLGLPWLMALMSQGAGPIVVDSSYFTLKLPFAAMIFSFFGMIVYHGRRRGFVKLQQNQSMRLFTIYVVTGVLLLIF